MPKKCKKTLKNATKKKRESPRVSVTKTQRNQITKSKQLLKALENKKATVRAVSVSRKPVPKPCSKTTHMPSLADLERMFEDSDDNKNDANITTRSSGNFNNRSDTSGQITITETIEILDHPLSPPVIKLPEIQRFSPLPSTSRDRKAFLENDKRLKNSSTSFEESNEESQSDVEIIDDMCETIVINDEYVPVSSVVLRDPNNTVTLNPGSPIVIDEPVPEPQDNLNETYSSTDNLEIIDIDDILAKNKAILQKQQNKKPLNAITRVEPSKVIQSNVSDNDLSVVVNGNLINDNNNILDQPQLTRTANTSQAAQQRGNNGFCCKCSENRYLLANYIKKKVAIEKRINTRDKNFVNKYIINPQEENISKSKGLGTGSCPICMESFSGQEIVATFCGHIFCKKCIDIALRTSGRRCPTCRKQFRGAKTYHQLFL